MKIENIREIKFLKTVRFGKSARYLTGAILEAPFSDDVKAEIRVGKHIEITKLIEENESETNVGGEEATWVRLPTEASPTNMSFKQFVLAHPERFPEFRENQKAIEKWQRFYPGEEAPFLKRENE